MRKPFIAGNWKMNLSRQEAVDLASGMANAQPTDAVDVAICPAFVHLDAVRQALGDSAIGLGAQNLYFEGNGAYTGETSSEMLSDIGCKYVILGHSERRHILGETDALIAKKVDKALAEGLIPIVCVGETLPEREAGTTQEVVETQFRGSIGHLDGDTLVGVVIAYEPVWAIGTGVVATPDQAEEVHADLRKLIENLYNSEVASKVRIQYGGSVKPDNAAELMGQPNVDGALVGGASLKTESFMGIIQSLA